MSYLAQEVAVRGQVGRPDRRNDLIFFFLPTRGGGDVLAELVDHEVHGRAAAVAVVDTVERLRPSPKETLKKNAYIYVRLVSAVWRRTTTQVRKPTDESSSVVHYCSC
jgi:hypothetical protein